MKKILGLILIVFAIAVVCMATLNQPTFEKINTIVKITAGATPYVDLSTAALFVDTPTDGQNQSITATGAHNVPGEISTIEFISTGTSAETITFSTGFKSVGTLTISATASRYQMIAFVSDGTYWLELCRSSTPMQ